MDRQVELLHSPEPRKTVVGSKLPTRQHGAAPRLLGGEQRHIECRGPTSSWVGESPARVDVTWDADLPEELASVLAHASVARWHPERWKPEQSSVWLRGSVGYAAIDVGEVLAIIRQKEADLPRYEAGFDACWLLIYGLWQASSFFDFDYLKPHMFTSKFDGVAFVDAGTGRNVQIT